MSWLVFLFDILACLILWTITIFLGFQYAYIIEAKRDNQLMNIDTISLFGGKRGLLCLIIFSAFAITFLYRLLFIRIDDIWLRLFDFVPRYMALMPIGCFPLLIIIYLRSFNKIR